MQSLKKRTEGFTIIEVMIVLVIAAVIILIVFLAVPALQRNSRNNQRKNAAGLISAAVAEYKTNNNGTLPPDSAAVTNTTGDLPFYELSQVQNLGIYSAYATAVFPNLVDWPDSNSTTLDNVFILINVKCNNSNNISNANGSAAVVYAVEQSNGTRRAACI